MYLASHRLSLQIPFSKCFTTLLISHFFAEEDFVFVATIASNKTSSIKNFSWFYISLYQWTPYNSCFARRTSQSLLRNCVYIENVMSGCCKIYKDMDLDIIIKNMIIVLFVADSMKIDGHLDPPRIKGGWVLWWSQKVW